MKFEIKNRFTGSIIFTADADSMKLAVELAVKQEVNLSEADLYEADLREANLNFARLDGASLVRARLDGARLDGASLDGARLDGARLDGARLDGASLDGASLVRARLDGASLDGASLDLATLPERTLRWFRDDLWAVLSSAPREAEGVLKALRAGKVNGSTYSGDCACLVGTIANVRGCNYMALGALVPDSSRPAEQFFLFIKPGNTPENNQAAKYAAQWVEEWLTGVRGAFAA